MDEDLDYAKEDVDEIIKLIAAKHGMAVSRDDPIMVLYTLNRRLLEDTRLGLEEHARTLKEEWEGLSSRVSDDTKQRAERIINAALTASNEMFERQVERATKEVTAAIQSQTEATIARIAKAGSKARQVAALHVTAASITLVAVLIAVAGLMVK